MDREVLFHYFKRLEPYLVLFIVYFIVGRVGLSIHPVNTFATFVWPASAVALAAIMLFGYRLWPAVLLAAFAVNLSVGANPLVALAIGCGNMLESLAGVYFLKHYIGFDANMQRMRDTVGIIATACIAPALSATIGVTSLFISGTTPASEIFSSWGAWWSGDALSILILGPFLLKWISRPLFKRTSGQYAELVFSIFFVAATAVFVFWSPPDSQFAYYLFIPLTWVALRTGPRGMTLAILVSTGIAIAGTLAGKGPYANFDLFSLGMFIATLGSLFPIFTSVVEERKNSQKDLSQHVEELEQALSKISSEDEAKKNFLAVLAHELRNPLAAILSSIELLRLEPQADASRTSPLVRTINEHVHAMRSMLDDVLDISRISRNKLVLRKEVASLDDILDHSVHSTQNFMNERYHRLSITKPGKPLYVEADPIRLEQILVNLLNNAAKYTNPRGVLQLAVREEKGMALISLKDNGVGISKSMQKKIFEPFFQVRRGKLATEGLGVGLPLTKQLVEMHGGTIEVKSDGEGTGSEFIVRLPLARPGQRKSEKKESEKTRKLRFVKNKRKILVVDDNEAAANALSRLLELRGHEVSVVYTGMAAVDAMKQQHPDLLILDIGLPDIDGYEVVRRLKETDSAGGSAIIALTGYGQVDDKERALKIGFDYHLTKPVGLKELEKAFRKVAHAHDAE